MSEPHFLGIHPITMVALEEKSGIPKVFWEYRLGIINACIAVLYLSVW